MNSANACPESAQQFWKTFRQAALANDTEKLSELTQFPLHIRGTLDDSPAKNINKSEFKKLLPAILGADPGMTEEPSTMTKYIQGFEKLSVNFCNPSGDQIRIGNWVFVQNNKTWRLVKAYIEE